MRIERGHHYFSQEGMRRWGKSCSEKILIAYKVTVFPMYSWLFHCHLIHVNMFYLATSFDAFWGMAEPIINLNLILFLPRYSKKDV